MSSPLTEGTLAKISVAMPKKRGAPKKKITVRLDDNGAPIIPQELIDAMKASGQSMDTAAVAGLKGKKQLSDEDLLQTVKGRFEVLARQARLMSEGKRRSQIVSGAPGVGKTYTIENILKAAADKGQCRYLMVHGTMTGVNLYRTLFRYRGPKDIVVFDDADDIFTDETAMNLLKAATDTSKTRILSYYSDTFSSAELGDGEEAEEGDIPQQFVFEGSVMFITNLDFDAFIAAGSNKYSKHMQALQDRSKYLDLLIHGRRELSLWIGHVLRSAKVLQVDYQITDAKVNEILTYLSENRNRARSLSIRSALHCAELMRDEPETWKQSADVLLLKGEK